jgi:hypothetical protein
MRDGIEPGECSGHAVWRMAAEGRRGHVDGVVVMLDWTAALAATGGTALVGAAATEAWAADSRIDIVRPIWNDQMRAAERIVESLERAQ